MPWISEPSFSKSQFHQIPSGKTRLYFRTDSSEIQCKFKICRTNMGHFCGLSHLMSMGILSPGAFSRKNLKHWGKKCIFKCLHMGTCSEMYQRCFFINQMVTSYLHFPYKTICAGSGEMLQLGVWPQGVDLLHPIFSSHQSCICNTCFI